jgi:hypothetical protein
VFADADVRLRPMPSPSPACSSGSARSGERLPQEVTGTPVEALIVPLIHVLLLGYLPIWLARWLNNRRSRRLRPADRGAPRRVSAGWRSPAIRGSRHDGPAAVSLPRAGCATDLFDATDLARCRMSGRTGGLAGFAKNAEGMAKPLALPVWTLLLGGGQCPAVPCASALAAGSWPAVAASAVAGARSARA